MCSSVGWDCSESRRKPVLNDFSIIFFWFQQSIVVLNHNLWWFEYCVQSQSMVHSLLLYKNIHFCSKFWIPNHASKTFINCIWIHCENLKQIAFRKQGKLYFEAPPQCWSADFLLRGRGSKLRCRQNILNFLQNPSKCGVAILLNRSLLSRVAPSPPIREDIVFMGLFLTI